jgi:hypothetical protein
VSEFDKYQQKRGQANEARAEQAFEHRTLTFLLREFNLTKEAARIARELAAESGRQDPLDLYAFGQAFRTFPIMLGVRRIHRLHTDKRAFLPAMFKNFKDVPFVTAYAEFFEQRCDEAETRAVGLVFPRKGIDRGLVIHNGVNLPPRVFHGLVLTYTGGKKETAHLYVQPFQSLIQALHNKGHGWRP